MILHRVDFEGGVRHLILHQIGLATAVQSQVDVIMIQGFFLIVVNDLDQACCRHIVQRLRVNFFLLGYQYHRVRNVTPVSQTAMVA